MLAARRSRWTLAVLLGTASTAHALKPATHASLATASCTKAGLPADLCKRIATEDYNTDNREWEDLRAHAQIDDGETACDAADRTAARVHELGSDLRGMLDRVARTGFPEDVEAAATLAGRALHTIQDNCAHHGMPNPQHAWASLSDFCLNTTLSPDIQEDAIACARSESDAVMRVVAAAVNARGIAARLGRAACPPSENDHGNTTGVCDARVLPGPLDGCGFLGRAGDWDGIDRRWENARVIPALRDAFSAGLAGEVGTGSICHGDETALSPAVSAPLQDVSMTPPTCASAHLLCLGKADGDVENPFAGGEDDGAAAGGCSAAGGDPGALLTGLLGLVIAGVTRRTRRA